MKSPSSAYNTVEIQRQKLLAAVDAFSKTSKGKILKALALAEEAHRGQYRDDGAPYVIHPIRMAVSLIKEFGYDAPALISAALLHDVIEDTPMTFSRIQKACGTHVASHVGDLTDARPEHETESMKRLRKQKKLIALLDKSKGSRIIKCADILDNMRSWPFLTNKSSAFPKLPRWVHEARANSLPFAKATDERMYQEIKRTLDGYEK
ncbi:bifunctional (p)ppGpp synthetase/guanosine-3',5'-bis(diphosphate) 3'-pyrophosphohydrolase [Candidatus Uhrbacteria bacterium]|nr:bifunctional (p)ppGpp synthetase/guanosine-3',5'-bis(diphosphate) 3'-pyrophosphohydrolase [Candidatus Uhrbacteria bacterium]